MLIVLNIMIIVFLLGMIAIWSTYGFFSSFLHLMIVVVAGVIAFACWEPLSFWLLGRMPATAWGVGLLAPFALSIILLRAVFDKYCKMNLKFPRLADQIGGGACGLGSGVLCAGMLLMGAGFLTSAPDIMGYQPYRMNKNTIEVNEEGQLWAFTRVDQWAGGFFSLISAGSMKPMGGTPLDVYKANIAQRAAVFHLTDDPFQAKAAPPKTVDLLEARVLTRDEFLDLVVTACFKALVTDEIDLEQIYLDTPVEDLGPYGEHYIDAFLAEHSRRLELMENTRTEVPLKDRPSAIFNVPGILALYPLISEQTIVPPVTGNPGRGGDGGGATAPAGGGRAPAGRGRGRGIVQVPEGSGRGDVRPDDNEPADTPDPDASGDETPEGAGGFNVQLAVYNDPLAFFDLVVEKQIKPTIDALERELNRLGAEYVVLVDTQWHKKPAGAFDQDGWLRLAIPSIRLNTREAGNDGVEYESLAPIAFSIEQDQGTGRRAFVDLVSRQYFTASAQIDDVKFAWFFALPRGHEAFRFEVRQLGFGLQDPLAASVSQPAGFYDQVTVIGAVDVPEQAAPPEGIQIGETTAVADLGERLPRSISPNAATRITPNKEKEPWTALEGSQSSILRGNSGGRNSQMREVDVSEGSRLIRVIINSDAAADFLAPAQQGQQDMWLRDTTNAEHAIIGFALLKDDDSMNVGLRPNSPYTADDLPRVGTGEVLYLYFQVPEGVTITDFVFKDKDGEGIPFAQPLTADPK
jgi:hypothetical protein